MSQGDGELKTGRGVYGEFLGEKMGTEGVGLCSFCNKINHQDHAFSVLLRPLGMR